METDRGDVRSNEDLTRATGEGLRWITYARIVSEVVTLASMVVLAHMIPPAAFGIFAIVVIAQELANTVPSEGVGSALVQRRTIGRRHLEGGLLLSLGIGVALALVVFVVGQLVVRPVFGDETANLIMVASPCFLLSSIGVVPSAVLRRRLDFARLSAIDVTGDADAHRRDHRAGDRGPRRTGARARLPGQPRGRRRDGVCVRAAAAAALAA